MPSQFKQGAGGLAPGVGTVRSAADPGAGGVFQAGPVAALARVFARQGAPAILQGFELGCQCGVEARSLRQGALGLVPASLGGQGLALPREGLGFGRQLAGPPGWTAWTSDAASGAAWSAGAPSAASAPASPPSPGAPASAGAAAPG